MKYRAMLYALIVILPLTAAAAGAEFNIRDFGATADDVSDDTKAILATLAACEKAGGGVVFVPAGTYRVSRQGTESPVLELPSNTILRGEGAASVLQFDPRVNQRNFWRMLGAGSKDCRNVIICQLHLDGSNTHLKYVKGVPEQNHGILFYGKDGVIENILLRDLLVENFSGDCIAVSRGCRNITISNVTVRNFLRQGIQLAGDEHARAYLVSGCQDLEGTVQPGGSTIHVEHARGLSDVIIADNRCRHSILAGGVNRLVIRGNVVTGRIEGNRNTSAIIQGNIVNGKGKKAALMQFGFADGLLVKDNIITSDEPDHSGIYVWGGASYNPTHSKRVSILDNLVRVTKEGIVLNGVEGGLVRDNMLELPAGEADIALRHCKNVTVIRRDAGTPKRQE